MAVDCLKNIARLNLPVYRFESDTTKIIYSGYSSIKKKYFARLMLSSEYHSSFAGIKLYRWIPDFVKSKGIDMAVCEISPIALNFFMGSKGYVIPEWTTVRINIDRPLEIICQRNVSNFGDVFRRIRRYNMTYEVLKDEESFKYFYDRMYIPYISKRYGAEAWIEGLDEILDSASSPLLIAVKENETIVGAGLVSISEGSLFLHRLGLMEGNDEYRRHGVIGAIYYFGVVEGQKAGCRYLDLGGTRAFLSDGLTKFKLRLGAEFITDLSTEKEYLWLWINEQSENARKFIEDNQFVYVDDSFRLVKSSSPISTEL